MSPVTPPTHIPILIGIAGCSGSGKTTLGRELAKRLDATLFPLDLYYRDLSEFPLDTREQRNFDHPDSLESELFIAHLRDLAQGHTIQRPVYDFKTHTRVPNRFTPITPGRFLIIEGILALHYPELLPLYTFSIYVEAPLDVCLARRIYRDIGERGRTEASVREQYQAAVRPMADLYVIPSRMHANLTVSGCESLDWSIEQVMSSLQALAISDLRA